jgi:exodeoxyribonuclease V gamma subunit
MNFYPLQPGLLILQGNRFELLRDAVFEWLAQHPLAPWQEDVFLVQSNAVAQWLKISLAQQRGICAASRMELPARFLWRSFRQVLGTVPNVSPLDRHALVWRLMAHLPSCVCQPGFEILRDYLNHADPQWALFQLSQRLADLFDQYQVYRSDWLLQWAQGRDNSVPAEQRWQPQLWRSLLKQLSGQEHANVRPELHLRFSQALQNGQAQNLSLAPRVVVFGMSHLPLQTLQALTALSSQTQVLLAVPNPCRYHWSDILGATTARQGSAHLPLRGGVDLSIIAPADMHEHAHPLLAAWGRQAGDFIRQLDAFDDMRAQHNHPALPKIDLFDETTGLEKLSQLAQVQAHIRDLTPLAEHPHLTLDEADRSVVFHVAHSTQREVEVLHDQLLQLLADTSQGHRLSPKDIVVMVPDIHTFATSIRAVFGQYPPLDARYIPFAIADTNPREHNPLVGAVQALLSLPTQRYAFTQLRDLLGVPAIAQRFGLHADDLPQITAWLQDVGLRWGLDLAQRAQQGFAACGDQNTWSASMRRLLLGYASGVQFEGIEPYADIGGLGAAIAGPVAMMIERLTLWHTVAQEGAEPERWAVMVRSLLEDCVAPQDDTDRQTINALHSALERWLHACEAAQFRGTVPLSIFGQTWLEHLVEPNVSMQFLSGGVTFCTLVPMRAIPFEVVCLLGMNEDDFPRAAQRVDFDLMAMPHLARAGDRSRFDDDRQLMLDALLSARRVLYTSWTGRSERDNSILAPSVLVAQWRDYLAQSWSPQSVLERTTEHPLQPFSRRYFEGGPLFTHACEWLSVHLPGNQKGIFSNVIVQPDDVTACIDVARLARFLKNPVQDFYRHQLGVVFAAHQTPEPDLENFSLPPLLRFDWLQRLLSGLDTSSSSDQISTTLQAAADKLHRSGLLPMANFGLFIRDELVTSTLPMLQVWCSLVQTHSQALPTHTLQFICKGITLQGQLNQWQTTAQDAAPQWHHIEPRNLCTKGTGITGIANLRADVLLPAWVHAALASANGIHTPGIWVGIDATVTIDPMALDQAQQTLQLLLSVFTQGQCQAMPWTCLTVMARLNSGNAIAQKTYEGSAFQRGEVLEPCLARHYPNYASLSANTALNDLADELFGLLQGWLEKSVRFVLHGVS